MTDEPEPILPVSAAHLLWPRGRLRRAIKLGAPTHEIGTAARPKAGVRMSELEAWARAQEARLVIPLAKERSTSAGFVVYPPCEGISEMLRRATDVQKDRYHNHECLPWETKRAVQLPAHFRVRVKRGSIVVACGKCLEVRLRKKVDAAWPITTQEVV